MANVINARRREIKGKEAAKKLRKQGIVPAILYGHGFESQMLELDGRQLAALMRGAGGVHGLLDLQIEGGDEHQVMVKSMQRHPTRQLITHVDLQKIRKGEKLHTEVPLRFLGEPKGAKLGGVLQHHLYEVRVECDATALPDGIDIDISEMNIGENIRVSDLPELPGLVYTNPPEELVVMVAARRGIELEEEEEAAAVAGAPAAEAAGQAEPEEG